MSTYLQMIAQIEELKKQAEKTRKEEFATVVKTIRRQIEDYGITVEDLGLSTKPRGSIGKLTDKKSKQKSRAKRAGSGIKVAPKYRDDLGNTWTGRGKQPKWITAAIAAGRSLESMLIR